MPAGRPSSYQPEYAEQAFRLALLGLTDVEMAKYFGIVEKTFYNWQNEHPEFLQAIKEGKEEADAKVADSLYKRAMGYSHPAVKIFADPKTGAEKVVEYTEHYPPDPTSMIFWLKNRKQGLWRDRHHVAIEDPDKVLADVLGVSKEELPE